MFDDVLAADSLVAEARRKLGALPCGRLALNAVPAADRIMALALRDALNRIEVDAGKRRMAEESIASLDRDIARHREEVRAALDHFYRQDAEVF